MTPPVETPESTNTEAAVAATMDHGDVTQGRLLTETAGHIDRVLRTKPTFSRERPLGNNLEDFHRWQKSVAAETGTALEAAIDLARREAFAEEERVFLKDVEMSLQILAGEDVGLVEMSLQILAGEDVGLMEDSDLLDYLKNPRANSGEICTKMFSLPTPPIELFENPYFAQRTLAYIYNRLPEKYRSGAGLLLSVILNNTLPWSALLQGKQRDEHQIINVSDMEDLPLLAYGLRGKLTILGNPGAYTGAYMSGGELFVPGEVGTQACYQMSSGTAHIGKADAHLGSQMRDGTIFATDGGKGFVGSEMTGGTIFIEDGGKNLGMQMSGKDAHIIAKKVGENCGIMMQNGIITILDSYNDKCPPIHPEDKGRIILPNGKVLKGGWWNR